MSNPSQTCEVCGARLPANAPGEPCPACLVRSAIGQPQGPPIKPDASLVRPEEGEPATGVSVPAEQGLGTMIGRYKLLEKVGEGGFGTVYVAEQREPVKRRVALKIIKLGMDTKQVIARFEAERQALALMDHPNIAKVLEAGATDAGRPYFVMELVRGIKITDYCDQNNLSTRQRLDLFVSVCQAIQHAHQKGIIHRDIKPSNILVTLHDGVPVPKVIDFGIAKATQGELTDKTVYTQLQEFIGTPAYMSPEQAEMSGLDIDTRADIYSLGVLLYELLTGKTPFDSQDLLEAGLEQMRRTIREKEPLRPSTRLTQELTSKVKSRKQKAEMDEDSSRRLLQIKKLIELLRGDLDWIVMKCLEKDRTRRYDTANGLAADVQRYLDTEPVTARPPSQLYRFRKMVRRNKLAFGAASAVVAALVIGLGLSTWLFVKERGTRQRAEMAEREQGRQRQRAEAAQSSEQKMRVNAEAQTLAARRKAYASDMSLLQQALARDDLGRAQQLLDRQRPQAGQQDLRGWEWRYCWQFCQSDAAFTLCQRSNSVTSVSFSGDGTLLAVATWSGEVTVWELPSRRLVFEHGAADKPVFASQADLAAYSVVGRGKVAFAPQGDSLAYYDATNPQKTVVLWNARQRAETGRLPQAEPLRDFALTRDGRLVTVGFGTSDFRSRSTNNITVWDVYSGAASDVLSVPLATYRMGTVFGITGDGKKIAYCAGGAESVRVQNVKARAVSLLEVTGDSASALSFSLDGQILAAGIGGGAIRLWDAQNQPLGTLEGHRAGVCCLKALPDGRTLASASADRTIRLWDLKTRQLIRTLRGQYGEFWTLDVSPDGRWLASGSREGSINLWDLASSTNRPSAYRTLQTTDFQRGFTYSPDGRLIGRLDNGHLLLCQAATPQEIETELPWTNILDFAFAPDSRRLAATDGSGHLILWDIPGQQVITNFVAHAGRAVLIGTGFMRGGHSLLTFRLEGEAKEWDIATWREIRRFQLDPQANWAVISPEVGLVATANIEEVELFSILSPDKRWHFATQPRVNDIRFSADGKTLAVPSDSGTVELWDTATRTRTATLRGVPLGFHCAAFSPDGERLAAGSFGQEAIKMWDLRSLEEVATLAAPGTKVNAQFSPDGNTIVAGNWSGLFHFWSAPSWLEIQAAERARPTAAPP